MQLVGLIVVFLLILAATYYTTKWVGKSTMVQGRNKNIKVIETYRISPGKYIQIIQIGEKYISIGVSKEHIEYLTDIEKEHLDLTGNSDGAPFEFKEVLFKMTNKK